MTTTPRPPPDAAERERAIHARRVNLLVDAGAGTGKTTILVARVVELVAPSDDALAAVPLGRVAAITFTRKAAGELKFRIREALLRELARDGATATRRRRLSDALAALDTAHVGTIHAFADRLLRLRPIEARQSPAYDVVEDASALAAETFAAFLAAAETGSLAAELDGLVDPDVAARAQAAVIDAIAAGVRPESREHPYGEWSGLDRLFERLIATRDVPPSVPAAQPPDLGRFRALVDEFSALASASRGDAAGSRFLAQLRRRLEALRDATDPAFILAALGRLRKNEPEIRKGTHFEDDAAGWRAWKAFDGDERKSPVRATPLWDDLCAPFHRFMARRLVAMQPAIVALHAKVKARHRAVDQVDLLLALRDLLRDRRDVRRAYQALFDAVLVDEFQDTDPLQAEIVLFLCEEGARAERWREVALAPGKLTLVGDPKQSIYRFRRADIAVYAEVRDLVARGPHAVARLTTNFRSEPSLVAWLGARFDEVLGTAAPGRPAFDPAEGTVANERLVAGREGRAAPRVLLVPLAADGAKKEGYRAAEARALAGWLRWLVEGPGRTIVDPTTGATRRAGYGDVAVLVSATTQLAVLFPELDRLGVPYAARGGTLFLSDPLHRQFLLALRAIADRDDGVAQAALLRPPFFALDLDDLARERAADAGSTHPGVRRARAAKAVLADLRRRRGERPPGATARELLERTAFGRALALGPNGAQRLDAVRELCLALDAVAAEEGLDFDGATARLRAWATDPIQLDPPRPVASEAVQILSVHQAKGLEFPVVFLWDGCADLATRARATPWVVSADGSAWAVELDGLSWAEPEDGDLARREKRYLDAEARRLAYVAATRARDLLVLPVAGPANPKWVTGCLAAGSPPELIEALETYAIGAEPAWARAVGPPGPPPTRDASGLAAEVSTAWASALRGAAAPRFAPTSVTAEAHRADVAPEPGEGEAGALERRESRFGNVFGETVHRAIGLALADERLSPGAAVARAARATGLAAHLAEAGADVARALAGLGEAGLRRPPGADLRLEYPVALARDGNLVGGYVDLLGLTGGRLAVVDFKTDAPPRGDLAASHGAYVEQVRSYARVVEALGLAPAGSVAAGLLFTAEGRIRWVE
jgi:ATP-dependent exoDNAse (exonuclease V) beta subunit